MKFWVLPIFVLVLASCSPDAEKSRPDPLQDQAIVYKPEASVLTGFFHYNWEMGRTVFAMALDGPVCLAVSDQARLRDEDAEDHFQFVEVRGHLSERGAYGHMGQCKYAFRVTQVIEQRDLTAVEQDLFGRLGRTFGETPPGALPGAAFSAE